MKTRSITFLAVALLAVGAFLWPSGSPKAMELVNHTYHWYMKKDGHDRRLTSNGYATRVNVSFHCGWGCWNHWYGIKPGHHKSRPGKGGHFGASPHWDSDILGRVSYIVPKQIKLVYLLKTACVGHVGKHKERGIASRFVLEGGVATAGPRLSC